MGNVLGNIDQKQLARDFTKKIEDGSNKMSNKIKDDLQRRIRGFHLSDKFLKEIDAALHTISILIQITLTILFFFVSFILLYANNNLNLNGLTMVCLYTSTTGLIMQFIYCILTKHDLNIKIFKVFFFASIFLKIILSML